MHNKFIYDEINNYGIIYKCKNKIFVLGKIHSFSTNDFYFFHLCVATVNLVSYFFDNAFTIRF